VHGHVPGRVADLFFSSRGASILLAALKSWEKRQVTRHRAGFGLYLNNVEKTSQILFVSVDTLYRKDNRAVHGPQVL
jgi:hypothetical protein